MPILIAKTRLRIPELGIEMLPNTRRFISGITLHGNYIRPAYESGQIDFDGTSLTQAQRDFISRWKRRGVAENRRPESRELSALHDSSRPPRGVDNNEPTDDSREREETPGCDTGLGKAERDTGSDSADAPNADSE